MQIFYVNEKKKKNKKQNTNLDRERDSITV